jgi:hypothetical protein
MFIYSYISELYEKEETFLYVIFDALDGLSMFLAKLSISMYYVYLSKTKITIYICTYVKGGKYFSH